MGAILNSQLPSDGNGSITSNLRMDCWKKDPKARPTAAQCRDTVTKYLA